MKNVVNQEVVDGGPGSGNFGHAGRKGEQGGSASSNGGTNNKANSESIEQENKFVESLNDGKIKLPNGWSAREVAQVGSIMEHIDEGYNSKYEQLRNAWSTEDDYGRAIEPDEDEIYDCERALESEISDKTGQKVTIASNDSGTYIKMEGSKEHPISPAKYFHLSSDQNEWETSSETSNDDFVKFVEKNIATEKSYKMA